MIRVALLGCGAISTQHLEAIAALEGIELAAVSSASEERARSVGERWGVPWTTSLDELLARDDVDAVTVATPSGLHAAQALAVLRSGRHAIVEKPIALAVADADALIAEARARGLTLATISQRRFEPGMRALRDAIVAGALGRLTHVIAEGFYHRPQSYYDSAAWRGTKALDGGVLMNQAIHAIDLLRWFGGPVERVAAHVATLGHEMEAEDTASVSLRFASGALGAIVATTCAAVERPVELRVHGDRGSVRMVGELAAEWEVPGVEAPTEDGGKALPAGTTGSATWGTSATGYLRQYGDLVEAIATGRPPAVTGEDGRAALEIVTAAYRSDETGTSVRLEVGR